MTKGFSVSNIDWKTRIITAEINNAVIDVTRLRLDYDNTMIRNIIVTEAVKLITWWCLA